jgi:hypothetical protein
VVHDERWRPLRVGKDFGPLEYKNDRALCEAGEAAHCQNKQHGSGNVKLLEPLNVKGLCRSRFRIVWDGLGRSRHFDIRVLYARFDWTERFRFGEDRSSLWFKVVTDLDELSAIPREEGSYLP